jgi:uncharacterized membrane protein YqaE (UPF0057 family)/GTP:adenosylcobinamide-phosphate guanylyltransferase
MKNILKLSSICAAVVFLSSCGNVNVASKRYSNGLNISLNKNTTPPEAFEAMGKREVAKLEKRLSTIETPALIAEMELPELSTKNIENFIPNTLNIKAEKVSNQVAKVADITSESIANLDLKQVLPEVKGLKKMVLKQAVKKATKNTKKGNFETDTVLLVILALLLPPLAVYLYEGSWTGRCTLNLILTLLCGIPGVIHALIVVLGNK